MKNEKCTNTFWKKSYNSPKLTSQKYQGTDLIFIDFTMHQAPHKHTGGKKQLMTHHYLGKIKKLKAHQNTKKKKSTSENKNQIPILSKTRFAHYHYS